MLGSAAGTLLAEFSDVGVRTLSDHRGYRVSHETREVVVTFFEATGTFQRYFTKKFHVPWHYLITHSNFNIWQLSRNIVHTLSRSVCVLCWRLDLTRPSWLESKIQWKLSNDVVRSFARHALVELQYVFCIPVPFVNTASVGNTHKVFHDQKYCANQEKKLRFPLGVPASFSKHHFLSSITFALNLVLFQHILTKVVWLFS